MRAIAESQREDPAAIVRDLAECDPGDDEQGVCTLCHSFPSSWRHPERPSHTNDCPYGRAIKFTLAYPLGPVTP